MTLEELYENGNYLNIGDIMEPNGKSIRENRSALEHKYPIGTLVELRFEDWHDGGSCSIGISRMWVVGQNRDCDGSPLYSLSFQQPSCVSGEKKDKVLLYYPEMNFGGNDYQSPGGLPGTFLNEDYSRGRLEGWKIGYPEDCLTPIERTDDIRTGKDCLKLHRLRYDSSKD